MKEIKVKVLRNDKGIDEGMELDVQCPELPEESTYCYAMDNEVNATDESANSICIGSSARYDMYESEDSNWLFEEEYEIVSQ